MSTQKIYDKIVAKNYSSNPFNKRIFEETFTELLSKSLPFREESIEKPKILDIGCGDAGFLKLFNQQVKDSVLCGIDISSVMMEKGQEEIEFLSIHMDAIKGLKLLVKLGVRFDYIVLSFVSAYLDLAEMLPFVKKLLSPKGLVLYQASLKNSFPIITKTVVEDYKNSKNPLRKLVREQFVKAKDNTYLFSSLDDLNNLLEKEGMCRLESYVKKINLEFSSLKDWVKFVRTGGWATPYMSGYLFIFIYLLLALKVYSYPKQEQAIIGCVIATNA